MQFPQIAQIGFIALASLGVFGFVSAARDGETRRACASLCALRPNYAAQNRTAPEFELPALDGGKVRLSDYRGKVVILNFWTKTCAPCLEEMPSIANLAKALRAHPKVVLLTISTDETFEDVRATMKSVLGTDAPFPILLDPDAEVVTAKFGTKLYPETWFIDPQGIIRARFDGQRDWASALTIDLANALHGPIPCEVSFLRGRPEGPAAGQCADLDHD
ncbi:MAG TPA: TlpA disulfide reductase family protein [Polyangiaceae bacterium]